MSPVDVQELRRLVAAGTPGPWGVEQTEDANWVGPMRACGDGKVERIVVHTDRGGLRPDVLARNDANAAAVAALVNAAPAILDEIEAARQAQTALALAGFGGGLVEQVVAVLGIIRELRRPLDAAQLRGRIHNDTEALKKMGACL